MKLGRIKAYSNAERAGLKEWDYVWSINGQEVERLIMMVMIMIIIVMIFVMIIIIVMIIVGIELTVRKRDKL